MDIVSAAPAGTAVAPWLVLGLVLGIGVVVLTGLATALVLHRRTPRTAATEPAGFREDDLPGFLESPPGSTTPIPRTSPRTSQGATAVPAGAALTMSIAAQHAQAASGARLPGGVDLLRVAAQQHGDLVDDDVAHEVGEVLAVVRADLQRAPVDDDPGRHLAPVLAMRGQDAGQRDAPVVEDVGVQHDLVGRGVLDPRPVSYTHLTLPTILLV